MADRTVKFVSAGGTIETRIGRGSTLVLLADPTRPQDGLALDLEANPAATERVILRFPAAMPAANDVLYVSAVSDGVATLGWTATVEGGGGVGGGGLQWVGEWEGTPVDNVFVSSYAGAWS